MKKRLLTGLAAAVAAVASAAAAAAPQSVTFSGAGGLTLQALALRADRRGPIPPSSRCTAAPASWMPRAARARATPTGANAGRGGIPGAVSRQFRLTRHRPAMPGRLASGSRRRRTRGGRHGALNYLAQRTDVDARRISLVGWSNGGSIDALRGRAGTIRRPASISRAPIAFYPGLPHAAEGRPLEQPRPPPGADRRADDWTPAAPCAELIADAKAKGEPAESSSIPAPITPRPPQSRRPHARGPRLHRERRRQGPHGTNPVARPTPSGASWTR